MADYFPPQPVKTIDWDKLGIQVCDVNGHIESHYSIKSGQWSPPRLVVNPYLQVHGLSPGLNYGQQAYEGLKAFRGPGNQTIHLFRPDRNAKRLQHSAEYVSIPPVPESLFLQAVKAAVACNAEYVPPHESGASMYIRPLVFGSGAHLGLSPPDEYTFAVYVIPAGVYHGVEPTKALVLDEFDRAAPKGTGSAKVGGNYAPVSRWGSKAYVEGYGVNLHLDSLTHTEIDEFSTSGFVGAIEDTRGNVTIVVPDSITVIDSVTSQSVQDIARSFGWKVEKRPIKYTELPNFSEVMAAGTAVSLVPIRSITRTIDCSDPASIVASLKQHTRLEVNGREETVTYIQSSQKEAGSICKRLALQLRAIQTGSVKDEFGWNHVVSEADKQKAVS
ncbi:hypothetical protein PspLS_11923 [Pyricularia sp. CBS 133598]|nr:hypothetical protein PspLS_11923 [Pyricularia sp. CBS 133598]